MTKITTTLLLTLLLNHLPLSAASPTPSSPLLAIRQDTSTLKNEEPEGLHSLILAAGKLFFGTATDVRYLDDKAHQAIVNNAQEFGMIVPENSQKWGELEKQGKGKVDFANADTIAAQAKGNGQLFRCHVLVWGAQLPSFVTSTSWTEKTLSAVLQAHITTTVSHFGSQCYSWDVVSEALSSSPDSNTLSITSLFHQVLGASYIPLSFYWTSLAADPSSKLYYNDFNLELSPLKAQGAVDIIHLIRNYTSPDDPSGEKNKARIDGIGLQSHLFVSSVPSLSSLISTLELFTTPPLNLEITFSELDISHVSLSPPPNSTQIEQQEKDYMTVISACLAVKGCVGITVWGFSDKYSWVKDAFPGKGGGCLYDENMKRKGSWFAIGEVLRKAGVVRSGIVGVDASMEAKVAAAVNSTVEGGGGDADEAVRKAARSGELMRGVNGTALMVAAGEGVGDAQGEGARGGEWWESLGCCRLGRMGGGDGLGYLGRSFLVSGCGTCFAYL